MGVITGLLGNVEFKKNWSFATQGRTMSKLRKTMKEYVLKICFDPLTDEILYVKEYIDGAKAVLHINNKEIELDEEIAKYVLGDIIGIA